METRFAVHGFGPVIDPRSRILILGSFPSVRSREERFFYMHPQNRFWALLSNLCSEDFLGADTEEKIRLLKKHGLALYDVVESCEIAGSSDRSIRNVVPADLRSMIRGTEITRFLLNGREAGTLFRRFFPDLLPIAAVLPSTSPANAARNLKSLVEVWGMEMSFPSSLPEGK